LIQYGNIEAYNDAETMEYLAINNNAKINELPADGQCMTHQETNPAPIITPIKTMNVGSGCLTPYLSLHTFKAVGEKRINRERVVINKLIQFSF
jgi:hypothetical protein